MKIKKDKEMERDFGRKRLTILGGVVVKDGFFEDVTNLNDVNLVNI